MDLFYFARKSDFEHANFVLNSNGFKNIDKESFRFFDCCLCEDSNLERFTKEGKSLDLVEKIVVVPHVTTRFTSGSKSCLPKISEIIHEKYLDKEIGIYTFSKKLPGSLNRENISIFRTKYPSMTYEGLMNQMIHQEFNGVEKTVNGNNLNTEIKEYSSKIESLGKPGSYCAYIPSTFH